MKNYYVISYKTAPDNNHTPINHNTLKMLKQNITSLKLLFLLFQLFRIDVTKTSPDAKEYLRNF